MGGVGRVGPRLGTGGRRVNQLEGRTTGAAPGARANVRSFGSEGPPQRPAPRASGPGTHCPHSGEHPGTRRSPHPATPGRTHSPRAAGSSLGAPGQVRRPAPLRRYQRPRGRGGGGVALGAAAPPIWAPRAPEAGLADALPPPTHSKLGTASLATPLGSRWACPPRCRLPVPGSGAGGPGHGVGGEACTFEAAGSSAR